MKEIKTEIGVIIGRFQVHELHSEHKNLIQSVINQHDKVMVFLGTTSAIGTRRNPLDFITRKLMLEESFPGKISIILPIADRKSNQVWSNDIDSKIGEVFPGKKVTLYGSRDSFIPFYEGKHTTCELEPKSYISATDIRKKVSQMTKKSADFRAGIIYSIYSQYPTVYSTVDIIIKRDNEILLGRKPGEHNWRFIGGFVDINDVDEIQTCKREVMEETGVEIDCLNFICSRRIEDWRYAKDSEKTIMTHLYEADYIFGSPQPMDDIAELKWFKTDDPRVIDTLVQEHKKLYSIWKSSIF